MVLIVDDNPENIFSLKRLLEANNFAVDTASSGEEALKKILKTVYALVILDVQMPVMDGFEVAEAMLGYSRAKNIPIIFLSAVNKDKKFITKGYASGGIDYITKPFDPDILLHKVQTFHRLYEQTRELHDAQHALRDEIEIRKKAQSEQQKKTQELQSIIESLPQIAFTASANGKIDYANEQWYQYADSIDNFPELCNSEVTLEELWAVTLLTGEKLTTEVCIVRQATGESRYHLLRVLPVRQNDSIVKWIGTFTDIHEQKMATEILEQRVTERTRELQQMNDALELSNSDLQQFASVASHDLKEPLRKIQVFSSIVRERYKDNLQQEVTDYFDKIIASSARMGRLINDLLVFSRLSVDSLFEEVDMNDILTNILTDLEIAITEKNAVINVQPFPAMDGVPGQLRQVFQNIISNALKFSIPGRTPVIDIKSEVIASKDINGKKDENGLYCRITVSDNGIGFKEMYLEKIFTIFQRLNPIDKYDGTGIGLAIAKKIIDKHNGIITARSTENEGSTFIIILPLHQAATYTPTEIQ